MSYPFSASGRGPLSGQYTELRGDLILSTLAQLQRRIGERFPQSGLSRVAADLDSLGKEVLVLVEQLRRPHWGLRLASIAAVVLLLGFVIGIITLSLRLSAGVNGWAEWLQAIESAINEVIFLGLALLFLWTWENRVKRRAALASLHRLRSLAHVVDMHQLTKDPAYLMAMPHSTTASSPTRFMTPFELVRYLDYCSELLSLTSKLAALHVQYLNDAVVLAAVNDLENLAHGLSSKIWQKIMILDMADPRGVRTAPAEQNDPDLQPVE